MEACIVLFLVLFFTETLSQLSVSFCILPSVTPSSEELIRLRHSAMSERMVKPGIMSKFTLVTWVRVFSLEFLRYFPWTCLCLRSMWMVWKEGWWCVLWILIMKNCHNKLSCKMAQYYVLKWWSFHQYPSTTTFVTAVLEWGQFYKFWQLNNT